jgi:hypothetical protein
MEVLYFIFLLGAVICFGVAAFASPRATRVNFVALGLLLFALVPLIQTLSGNFKL